MSTEGHNADCDAALEWQAAVGSLTLHIIDTRSPAWKNADGSRRRSGPRALCGRYPQRNADGVWWSWPVRDVGTTIPGSRAFHLVACGDCDARVIASAEDA